LIGSAIDTLVGLFSPTSQIRRIQARNAIGKLKRSYSGSEPSRIAAGRKPKNYSADQELLGPWGADTMRAWARDLVRNQAYANGVVDTIVSSVVGCGINPQSVYETPEGDDIELVNDIRDRTFELWAEACDINGAMSFWELQALSLREMVEAGEVLLRIHRTSGKESRGVSRPVPLALELIEADRLAGDKDTYASRLAKSGENRITRGVELDRYGKPVAYWIYPDHPLQPYTFDRTPERIPAGEIIHLFRRDRVGQSRGVSWFAPVLSWLRDLGIYVDNELQASAVASCFTVAIKSETPVGSLIDPDGGDATDSAGNLYEQVSPGMVMRLNPNEDVVGLNPGRPNSASEPWIGLMLRAIAVGTGLSYEIVARDYSQTNYSSNRASQLEDRRRFRRIQAYLQHHLCQPVWDAFCEQAALAGVDGFPSSTELLDDRRKYAPVEWQTPEWEWVDPTSEQSAAQSAIDSFMSTYQTELGSRGRSWRTVFYQRAKEDKLKTRLGLLSPAEKEIEATASSQPSPGVVGAPEVNVASTALNGAQVTSLMEVVTQVGTGAMPKATAVAVITAAFPTMSMDTINAIIDPIEPGSVSADGAPVAVDATASGAVEMGTSEMAGLSTQQWNRNRKAIQKTLTELAEGTMSEAAARVFLSSTGMNATNVDILIADALDGTVDTPITEEQPSAV
jgi:lambda family phage portal protein